MGAERVQELLELVGLWLYRLEMVSVCPGDAAALGHRPGPDGDPR